MAIEYREKTLKCHSRQNILVWNCVMNWTKHAVIVRHWHKRTVTLRFQKNKEMENEHCFCPLVDLPLNIPTPSSSQQHSGQSSKPMAWAIFISSSLVVALLFYLVYFLNMRAQTKPANTVTSDAVYSYPRYIIRPYFLQIYLYNALVFALCIYLYIAHILLLASANFIYPRTWKFAVWESFKGEDDDNDKNKDGIEKDLAWAHSRRRCCCDCCCCHRRQIPFQSIVSHLARPSHTSFPYRNYAWDCEDGFVCVCVRSLMLYVLCLCYGSPTLRHTHTHTRLQNIHKRQKLSLPPTLARTYTLYILFY